MNAAQETDTPNLRLRRATLDDVTCRIDRKGKGNYAVYVGDREVSVDCFSRLKDAKRYIENRAESDAKLKRAAEFRAKAARLKAEGVGRLPRSSSNLYGDTLCYVAGMQVTAKELRCEVDGGRAWEIFLERNSIGHVSEFSTGKVCMHHTTDAAISNTVPYGKLEVVAERLANTILADAFYSRG